MADAVAVIQNQDRPLGEQWEMRHWYIDYDALASWYNNIIIQHCYHYTMQVILGWEATPARALCGPYRGGARLILNFHMDYRLMWLAAWDITKSRFSSYKVLLKVPTVPSALAAANVSVPSTLFASYDYTVHLSRRHRVRAELLAIDTAVARLIRIAWSLLMEVPLHTACGATERMQTRSETPDCACGQVAEFSCNGCSHQRCGQCFTGAHEDLPFHAIKAWSDILESYTVTSLRDLGLRIALGHAGATCAQRCTERVEAITVRGMVTVTVDFCSCEGAVCPEEQMRAHGWQPMRSNFVLAVPLAVMCLYLTMSTSSPGSSCENPLVFDARGRRVRVNRVSVEQAAGGHRRRRAAAPHAPPPRPRIYQGPASTIRVTPPPPPPAPHRGSVSMIQVTPSPSPPLPPLLPPPPFSARSPSQAPTSPTVSSPARSTAIRHSIVQHGGRTRQIPPPTMENLWLGPGRPQNYDAVEEYHRCAICQGVKAHPVSQVFPLEPATNAGIAIAMFAFVSGSTKAGNVPSVGPRSTARHFASSLRRRHCARRMRGGGWIQL
ncbi:hypothetical protein B0H14DRAFT_2608740 [Mycena olivaceomarginata]|nr:hypothetical protein B0H14DRAFT_2608740 [Mycena olivaceomarginata]